MSVIVGGSNDRIGFLRGGSQAQTGGTVHLFTCSPINI